MLSAIKSCLLLLPELFNLTFYCHGTKTTPSDVDGTPKVFSQYTPTLLVLICFIEGLSLSDAEANDLIHTMLQSTISFMSTSTMPSTFWQMVPATEALHTPPPTLVQTPSSITLLPGITIVIILDKDYDYPFM